MSTAAICIEKLSKQYHLGGPQAGAYRTIRESLSAGVGRARKAVTALARQPGATSANGQQKTARQDTFWALRDVSFDIEPGEVVGVIGRNGAGKSTLLKILSQITEPTEGRVTIRGRVGSLLEVGTGFHHELTGRENIFLNGAILGMTRKEIKAKFDDIVAFAEVGPFLDTPVKRYSSGMFVRLAFAVASHLEPEVLIVDEVLAVGDQAFQKKCLGKMDEVSRSGRTVLFVSHNMATILNLCEKVAVLDKGRLAFVGNCEEGVQLYTNSASESSGGDVDLTGHPRRRHGLKQILGRVRLLTDAGRPTDQLLCGERITLEVEIAPDCPPGDYHVAIGFDDILGCRLFTAATYLSETLPSPDKTMRRYRCTIDELPLCPGRYALTLNAGPRENVWTDMIDQALWLDVVATDFYGNGRLPNPDWGRFLIRSDWIGMREPSGMGPQSVNGHIAT
jgi:lipopolysaccharide transport system ATP-binding protein